MIRWIDVHPNDSTRSDPDQIAGEERRARSETAARMAAQIPLGRLGRAEDIGPVAVFLASEDARWITGDVIYASGGLRWPRTTRHGRPPSSRGFGRRATIRGRPQGLQCAAHRQVEIDEAAVGAVRLALLPDDGPIGQLFFWNGTVVPW